MKKIISMLVAFSLLFSSAQFVSASEVETENINPYYISYSENGEILNYNMPLNLGKARAEDGTYLKKVFITDGEMSNVYCGYHPQTKIWSNPACYYFTDNSSVTISFTFSVGDKSYGGALGISASAPSSTATRSYLADQDRKSKIIVYADYDYIIYKGEVRDIYTDEILNTFEFTELTKTGEFFKVVYLAE